MRFAACHAFLEGTQLCNSKHFSHVKIAGADRGEGARGEVHGAESGGGSFLISFWSFVLSMENRAM